MSEPTLKGQKRDTMLSSFCSLITGGSMMNLKETINFKTLREKGPAAIDVKGDEVVQVISKGSEIKVIISQEHYLNLLAAYNQLLVKAGAKEETVDFDERLQSFEERLTKIIKKAEGPIKAGRKWQDGRKSAGNN
jgi:hypothetical protein